MFVQNASAMASQCSHVCGSGLETRAWMQDVSVDAAVSYACDDCWGADDGDCDGGGGGGKEE
jgi:hypothetical protein